MTAIPASVIPRSRGLDTEEPEFAEEDDIPSDDTTVDDTAWLRDASSRDIERE